MNGGVFFVVGLQPTIWWVAGSQGYARFTSFALC